MSVLWMFMATLLYTEMGVVGLLLLPRITAQRWHNIFKLSFLKALGEQIDYYFYPILVGFLFCLADSITQLLKHAAKKEMRQDLDQELKNAADLFRAQRNLYIIGFAVFLFFVIQRLVTIITGQAQSVFHQTLSASPNLVYVNIKNENIAEILRAIESTCPDLTNVTFVEKKTGDDPSSRSRPGEKEDASPPSKRATMDSAHQPWEDLKLALSKWPKLETITFYKVSPEYITAILNVFHKDLNHLSFIGCKLIDLAYLQRCAQLISLHISSTCSLDSYEDVPALSADTFLPNLKSFSCKICLGAVSSVFEAKSTLNQLILKCCHMDVQECIQQKWRSLEILHLQRCSGLVDMAAVSHLIDELVNLKELFLHYCLEYNGPNNLARQIMQKAYKKPTPVNVQFKFYRDVRCLLNPMSNVAGKSLGPAPWEMKREDEDFPPSRRSDVSPAQSIHSTAAYDPYESYDEMYSDSE